MKTPTILLFALLFACNGFAQNLTKLSYHEIDSMMMIYYQMGAFEKVIPYMEAGRKKAAKEFGEQDSVFAEYTNNLAFFYKQTLQYSKALPLFVQTVEIFEKNLGADHPNFSAALNNLAGMYRDMGSYELAMPLFIRTINIEKITLGTEHPEFATSLNNLAGLHQDMGNYELALPLYMQSLNIRKKVLGEEHPRYANALNNLGILYQRMGSYELALPMYIQAKNIREKTLGPENPEFATSLNNLATLYQAMGNYKDALPLYIQAKKIREKILGAEHPTFATSLNNLAALYRDMDDYQQALPLFVQSKNIIEKTLGTTHANFGGSLNNITELYQDLGQTEAAWKTLQQVLQVSSGIAISMEINAGWADSLLQANYPSNKHLEEMMIALKIAYGLLDKTDKTKKIIIANLATALLVKTRHKHTNDGDKLRILAQSNDWLLRSLKVFHKEEHIAQAFELADQNKSVLLLQATKAEQAYQLGELPDSLVLLDKNLIKQRDKIEATLLEKRPESIKDSLRTVLIQVHHEMKSFKDMIEKKYPKYAHLKYQQVDAKAKDIQKLLPAKTALLEYVIADSVVHIFYVDKNELRWIEKPLNNKELKDNIKELHQVLSDYDLLVKNAERSYQRYTELAHWFYKNLVNPVLENNKKLSKEDLKRIENLIIVSDGELAHLPFEAFLVDEADQKETDYAELHYMLNDYNISYNYSATLWKENMESPAPKNNGQMLAMAGNYEIKLDSGMLNIRLPTDQWLRESLAPLASARQEVEGLEQEFSGFFAFDKQASEKVVKEIAGDYAIIHLAMHGLLDSKRPLLSSLAFTEDSDSTESNFWQAHEISKMQLNANLVVLSACETGYGHFEKGNGIASLARAFMYAGASSLIVSLWQVHDYSTSEIMKRFYLNLAAGMPKDVALSQAKLAYIQLAQGIAAHPAFWSPFIQIGNTEPMYLKTKGGYLWWGIGAGILALGGIAVVLRNRRKE